MQVHVPSKLPLSAIISLLLFGSPLPGIAHADNMAESANLFAPKGLSPCAPNDPVATLEGRVATSIGGQFLGCFQSEQRIETPGATELAPVPREYAFAIRLAGGGYTSADLDKLLSTVTAQWKDFQPLSTEFHDKYIARLNALIKGTGETTTTIASIKPVLVSIDRLDAKSYSVVSIRSYVFNGNGGQVRTTKVNADAVVLRGRDLIRLTMQRMLTGASDVGQIRAEVSEWARATEGTNP
jgi:hypothetical protein